MKHESISHSSSSFERSSSRLSPVRKSAPCGQPEVDEHREVSLTYSLLHCKAVLRAENILQDKLSLTAKRTLEAYSSCGVSESSVCYLLKLCLVEKCKKDKSNWHYINFVKGFALQ